MSSAELQPSAVYRPSSSPAIQQETFRSGQQGRTYIIYDNAGMGGGQAPAGRGPYNLYNRLPPVNYNAQTRPAGLPLILRNRSVVFNAWLVAMVVVGFDEWHNLGILPRPVRLWDTSLVYGLLIMLSMVDIMVPIANALAIGYVIALMYQYFTGNLTPGGTASQQQGISDAGVQGVQQSASNISIAGTPPTPGANFPLNTQLTSQP